MTDINTPNLGALIATSTTSQVLGAAFAVVWLAYHHLPDNGTGVDTKTLENAITVIFSTGCSLAGMIAHWIVVRFLTPKT